MLLPTRGRPGPLARSIESLTFRVSRPDELEILVAVDPDDPTGDQVIALLHDLPISTCYVVARERYGYRGLHHYFNLLAREATGGWLLLWNDDALMQTTRWDDILRGVDWRYLVAELRDQHWTARGMSTFPAVRRAAVEAVGAFSPHTCHCDTYWTQLSRDTSTAIEVPIEVMHLRFDISGQHNDRTWREGQDQYDTHNYYSPEVQAKIAADTSKILACAAFRAQHIKE